ncbi:MAG: hypothetical protein AMXMBFR13_26460 [Phycisphaerae bacterium]
MWIYVRLLRPAEWIKNTFVFAALAFGGKLTDLTAIRLSLLAFAAFCLASSAGYVFNDILDRERDRLHPVKKGRPLASGAVSVGTALVLVLLLLTGSVVTAWGLPPRFLATLCAYLFLTVSYSVALKHRMLLDVITIATLFVLRAIAGAYAIDVPWSSWLLICTFMLCLFLGFGKRRCEIAMIGGSDAALLGHRRTLVRYTPDLLNQLLSTSGGIAIITFLLYTLSPESPDAPIHFGQRRGNLVYTLPLVVYGIFRYAMLIELGKATGPTDLLIKDPPFLAAILLWVLAATLILYGWPLPLPA